ncbi:MAG TPA: hypothetical protein VJW75_11535 [Candidatus Eisenbacteria bacterium]|nr:hypothetical protein [Candidatus Eisenbacteria bacterium]
MKTHRWSMALLGVVLLSAGLAGTTQAGEQQRSDVIREADIQAQIDGRIDSEDGDRQAIQDLLRRPEVRRIAGAAGLDLKRANAAAGVLSGPELKEISARARELNGAIGGRESVTISLAALIIILLVIIILAD